MGFFVRFTYNTADCFYPGMIKTKGSTNMELEGKKVNFLGDSITEGAGATDADKIYHAVFKNLSKASEVRNFGIGGTRLAKQNVPSENAKYDEYFSLRADKMPDDADLVVVFGGTNDYGHGDAQIGTFSDRSVDTFYGACHELFLKLINKYPESEIVVMTPIKRENENKPNAATGKVLKDYADIIKEVAQFYAIPVLDLYSMSGIVPDVPIIKEKYTSDGLHPNDSGHALIARRLIGFLKTL